KKLQGKKLLEQIVDPSSQIHEKYQNYQFVMNDGRVVAGVVVKEDDAEYHVLTNLLTPQIVMRLRKADIDQRVASRISPMPPGLVNVLTKDEILNLLSYVEAGGYRLPDHLKHQHGHKPE
ncbi:MAG TPA: hypothetical protein VGI75_08125, partial [Pirellulales bacterium]